MKDSIVYISLILGTVIAAFTYIYNYDAQYGACSANPVPIWKYFWNTITLKYIRETIKKKD